MLNIENVLVVGAVSDTDGRITLTTREKWSNPRMEFETRSLVSNITEIHDGFGVCPINAMYAILPFLKP